MAVLVVIAPGDEPTNLVRLGWKIAIGRDEGLLIVRVQRGKQAGEIDLLTTGEERVDPMIGAIRSVAAETQRRTDDGGDTSPLTLRVVGGDDPRAALMAEIERVEPSLILCGYQKDEREALREHLLRAATPPVMVVTPGAAPDLKRLLVPTAGGRHAAEALRIAAAINRREGGITTALYVESPEMADGEAVGAKVLDDALRRAGVAGAPGIQPAVVLHGRPRDAIKQEAERHDVVLLGASDRGYAQRLLFDTLPQALVKDRGDRIVAVVRAARPWGARVRERVERTLSLTVPQLDRGARVDLFERLQTGSRWGFDFFALIALSTSIAALGLLQSSAAVVIGAMLVAPLMTPLLGAGLALLQGNQVLLRSAAKAIVLGFCTALVIGVVVGLVSPVKILTSEMAARGGPTLLDMGVAFIAGMAAAYSTARPHLIAALPGVAIAAALVPPVATTGISLAFGELATAQGAALLFGTNVVAIILGAALSWYAAGIRGGGERLWPRRVIAALVLCLAALMVPLGSYLWSLARRDVSPVRDTVVATTEGAGYRLVRMERRDDVLEIHIQAPEVPGRDFAATLAGKVREATGDPVKVRLVTLLAAEAEAR